MKGILKRFLARRQPSTEHRPTIDEASTAALIARRAMRASNRRADLAAAYEAKHLALAAGRKT